MLSNHRLRNRIAGLSVGAIFAVLTLFLIFGLSYIATFSNVAHVSTSVLWNTFTDGWSQRNAFQNKDVTFLILGLDNRDDAFEKTLLTDTMMLASLNTPTNNLTVLPLPRDVWIDEYKTKINALYFYGGVPLTKSVVEQLTGIQVDYYVIIDYRKLPGFVDTLEGVTIDIEKSFTDNKYPNPYYTEDGVNGPPYVTIFFEKGLQILGGEQTLHYVRSRGSDDESEGSDAGRSHRQLQVMRALIERLTDKNILMNPGATGDLYRLWHDDIDTNMSDSEIIGLSVAIGTHPITISSVHIPTSADTADSPILIHPSVSTYGLWVWEPADPTGKQLKDFVKEHLKRS